jgi:glycosyltransferase involved in cell wall biosynthesis
VIIPVRNGERHIAHQLEALSRQSYPRSWELVVVDNGCTDRTLAVVEEWRERLPSVTVVDASRRPGLNYARNRGATGSHGDLLAFCDADDVVSPDWLAALAAAAVRADLVAGPLDVERLNDGLARVWRPESSMTQLDLKHDLLPHAPGGNCAVWRDVALDLGWDERFAFGSSDIEFSWRVQRAGYTLTFAEDATVHLRFRESKWELARQYFRYGVSDAKLYRRFRREGMKRSSTRDAARTWWELVRSAGELASTEGRGRWLRVAGRSFGRAVGSVRWCVLFL